MPYILIRTWLGLLYGTGASNHNRSAADIAEQVPPKTK
jgi:hypothetical protein